LSAAAAQEAHPNERGAKQQQRWRQWDYARRIAEIKVTETITQA
jgi:hypothetical protein